MQQEEITFDELKSAIESVVDLLCKKGHPHLSVVITQREVRVVEDKIGMPLPYDD